MRLILSKSDHLNAKYTVQLEDYLSVDNPSAGIHSNPEPYEDVEPGPTTQNNPAHAISTAVSNLCNTSTEKFNNGQVLYCVSTPWKAFNCVSTIKKALPLDFEVGRSSSGQETRFAHFAQIEFKTVAPSVMKFGGHEIKVSDFFQKQGMRLWSYGRDRAFTGPDGKTYKWILGSTSLLILGDSTESIVAKLHSKRFGIFHKARPASLEITSLGMHMVDLIFITFVYIQKLRDDREDSTKSG